MILGLRYVQHGVAEVEPFSNTNYHAYFNLDDVQLKYKIDSRSVDSWGVKPLKRIAQVRGWWKREGRLVGQ